MAPPSESFESLTHDIYPGIAPEKFSGSNKGRVVFITGASKGLGLASAKAFAATGASLYISARSGDVLEKVKSELESTYKVPVAYTTIDINNEASVKAAVEKAVQLYGKIDVVISNAGGGDPRGPIGDASLVREWWDCMELNVKGSFFVASYTISELRKSKGYIIFLSSALAQIRIPGGSGYNIAKLSLIRLAEWIHAENNGDIKAFAVHPGAVLTDLSAALAASSPFFKSIFIDTPELGAWTQVRLTSGTEDWLSGRFYDSGWTFEGIEKFKEQILADDALKIRLALPHSN